MDVAPCCHQPLAGTLVVAPGRWIPLAVVLLVPQSPAVDSGTADLARYSLCRIAVGFGRSSTSRALFPRLLRVGRRLDRVLRR